MTADVVDGATLALRVASHGVCCSHLVLPLGQDSTNVAAVSEGIRTAAAAWKLSTGREPILSGPQLTSIPGQCDLSVSIGTNDFRFAYDLQSSLINTTAEASTWIFSVPYNTVANAAATHPLEFVTYLRVTRGAYRAIGWPLELAMVEAISRLLVQYQTEIAAEIRYTLGWPDLAVHGTSCASADDLLTLLLRLESLQVPQPNGGAIPVFQRAVTLVGATGQTSKINPKVKPLVLLRAAPGRLPEALTAVGDLFLEAHDSYVLDGKWDGAVMARRAMGAAAFFARRDQSVERLRANGVERTETHILSRKIVPGAPFESQPAPLLPVLDGADALERACSCARPESLQALETLLKELESDAFLPYGLRTTVTGCLALFRFALQDTANCCDLLPPLSACVHGLRRILHKAEEIFLLASEPESRLQTEWFALLQQYESDIQDWCRVSRRVLSERTAGSFEALFTRSYSVTGYRGGMQKSLLIADGLAQVFYSRLPERLREDHQQERSFATVFKSGGTITNMRLTGVIQIPLRYAFSLHLVLPQVWHEIAQLVYHRLYSPPAIEARQLEEDIRAADERLLGDLGLKNRSLWYERNEIFELLGDAFSDVLVFRYGFNSRLPEYLVYLTTLVLETMRYKAGGQVGSCPPEVVFRHWQMLLLRLCFVVQASRLLEQATLFPKSEKSFRTQAVAKRAEISDMSASLLSHSLMERIEETVLKTRRYDKTWVPDGVVANVARHLTTVVYRDVFSPRIDDLAWLLHSEDYDPQEPSALPQELLDGCVLDESDPRTISDWYFRTYLDEVRRLLEAEPQVPGLTAPVPRFQMLASLGRTAVLTFQRT